MFMKNENEKKGLFERLVGSKRAKKSSCCCSFEIEELPEKTTDIEDSKDTLKSKRKSCCN